MVWRRVKTTKVSHTYGFELNRVYLKQIHSYFSSNFAKVRRFSFDMCLTDDCVCLMCAVLPSGLILLCVLTHIHRQTQMIDRCAGADAQYV